MLFCQLYNIHPFSAIICSINKKDMRKELCRLKSCGHWNSPPFWYAPIFSNCFPPKSQKILKEPGIYGILEHHNELGFPGSRRCLLNKGDCKRYEIRYCGKGHLFISPYFSINNDITHFSKLFHSINPHISMYLHGCLVRNWCGE